MRPNFGRLLAPDPGMPIVLSLHCALFDIIQCAEALAKAEEPAPVNAMDALIAEWWAYVRRMGLVVRPLRIEVIDRDPVELGSEVPLDLRHQPPDIGLQVGIFRAVLGRDDEAELVAVASRALEEIVAIGAVSLGAVKFTGQSLARNPVTLNVAHVRAGSPVSLTL